MGREQPKVTHKMCSLHLNGNTRRSQLSKIKHVKALMQTVKHYVHFMPLLNLHLLNIYYLFIPVTNFQEIRLNKTLFFYLRLESSKESRKGSQKVHDTEVCIKCRKNAEEGHLIEWTAR